MFHAGAGAKEIKKRNKEEMKEDKKYYEKKLKRKLTMNEYREIIEKEMKKDGVI